MDATPIDFGDARPLGGGHPMGIISPRKKSDAALARTWAAIHEAAMTVGAIAHIDAAQLRCVMDLGMERSPLGRDDAVELALQDLADLMQRGIAALLTAHTSGGAPQAAALALWREFVEARDRLVAGSTALSGLPFQS